MNDDVLAMGRALCDFSRRSLRALSTEAALRTAPGSDWLDSLARRLRRQPGSEEASSSTLHPALSQHEEDEPRGLASPLVAPHDRSSFTPLRGCPPASPEPE
jgi:hypothetical protein